MPIGPPARLPAPAFPAPMVHVAPAPESTVPAPDLVVDSVVGSSSRPHVGEPVWYTVIVRNAGDADSGPFTLGLRGETVHEDREVYRLDAGDTVTLENLGPVRPHQSGRPFLVQAVADPQGAVPDADRTNNDKWDSLWVQP